MLALTLADRDVVMDTTEEGDTLLERDGDDDAECDGDVEIFGECVGDEDIEELRDSMALLD